MNLSPSYFNDAINWGNFFFSNFTARFTKKNQKLFIYWKKCVITFSKQIVFFFFFLLFEWTMCSIKMSTFTTSFKNYVTINTKKKTECIRYVIKANKIYLTVLWPKNIKKKTNHTKLSMLPQSLCLLVITTTCLFIRIYDFFLLNKKQQQK